mmetsp:Transcript_8095/g.9652  ORF Transcript_8095/g.9652 Transcript_8095/m.9652 type:complete len:612 (-) Transcript_8095:62-1897(-)
MALLVAACDYKDKLKSTSIGVAVLIFTFGMLPGIVRVSCPSLSELVTYDDEELCPSSSFLGEGGFANFFSILLMINTVFVSFPLNMFFVATIFGSLRHQKCSKTYGLLARIDMMSTPVSKCPVFDMTVHTNIRAWIRSLLSLHFFGERYYHRVDLFAKLCALILISLLIWMYIFSLEINNHDELNGANELILDIRYWSVMFLLIVWGGAFGLILGIMSDTNVELKQHEILFLLHRLNVREKRVINHHKNASFKEKNLNSNSIKEEERTIIVKPKKILDKKVSISDMRASPRIFDIEDETEGQNESGNNLFEHKINNDKNDQDKNEDKHEDKNDNQNGDQNGDEEYDDKDKDNDDDNDIELIETHTTKSTNTSPPSPLSDTTTRTVIPPSSSSTTTTTISTTTLPTSIPKQEENKIEVTKEKIIKEQEKVEKDPTSKGVTTELLTNRVNNKSTNKVSPAPLIKANSCPFKKTDKESLLDSVLNKEKEKNIKNIKSLKENKLYQPLSQFDQKKNNEKVLVPPLNTQQDAAMKANKDMMEQMMMKMMPNQKMIESEELDDLMDTAVMILEAQMRVNPRRFLGAHASWNLVKSYLFAWGTLIGFSLSVAGINYSR